MLSIRFLSLLTGALVFSSPVDAQNRRAQPLSTNTAPEYPAMHRAAGIEGRVRMSFVVDTSGRPVEGSLRALRPENDSFLHAARVALATWRFQPAVRGGKRVVDTLVQSFEFEPTSSRIALFMKPVASTSTQIAPGEWYIKLSGPDVPPNLPTVDARTQRDIAFAVLDTLLAELIPPDTARVARIACIAMSDDRREVDARTVQMRPDEPSVAQLAALQRTRLAVVPARRCPPTLSSPVRVARVDGSYDASAPGEDPFELKVNTARVLGDGRMLMGADVGRNFSGRTYNCLATPDSLRVSGWRAVCHPDRWRTF